MDILTYKNEFLDEIYYKINHTSGLTVYVMSKENCKSSFAVFSTNYGSIDNSFTVDGSEYTFPDGVAHFLEHKLFESPDLGAFERYAKTGADANAFTSFDVTSYIFSCADNFEASLEILLDFVKHPYFTKENVKKEQGIIAQEIKMYDDDSDWKLLFGLLKAMYKDNPIGTELAGTVNSIAEINEEILYKCYNTFYNNHNMVLAVAGNVTIEQVLTVADKCLSYEEPVDVKRKTYPDGDIVKNYTEKCMNVNKSKFKFGYKEPAEKSSDLKYIISVSIALELIISKTTDFYEELLEKELINASFECEHFYGRGFNVISFGGESDNPEEVCRLIKERIARLKKYGVDEDDFECIRRKKYGSEIKSFNHIETLANALASLHFQGNGIFDIFEIYKTISKKDIDEVIRNSFDENKCVLSLVK